MEIESVYATGTPDPRRIRGSLTAAAPITAALTIEGDIQTISGDIHVKISGTAVHKVQAVIIRTEHGDVVYPPEARYTP